MYSRSTLFWLYSSRAAVVYGQPPLPNIKTFFFMGFILAQLILRVPEKRTLYRPWKTGGRLATSRGIKYHSSRTLEGENRWVIVDDEPYAF